MRKIIHHIRKQPEETRKQILYLIMLVVTAMMVFLWITSLSKNFSDPSTELKMEEDLEPFSQLKDDLMGGYTDSYPLGE